MSFLVFLFLISISAAQQVCQPLQPVLHGSVEYVNTQPGNVHTANIKCDKGFEMVGQSTIKCINGKWDGIPGTCVKQTSSQFCPSIHLQNSFIFYYPFSLSGKYGEGTKATRICTPMNLPVGPSSSVCKNGEWTPVMKDCKDMFAPNLCPELKTKTGTVSYNPTNPRALLTTAVLNCPNDMQPYGANMALCMINGQWSNWLGTCQLSCPVLSNPLNGVVEYDLLHPRAKGTIAWLSCNLPYMTAGKIVVKCGDNGTWSDSLGTCERLPNYCSSLFVDNGSIEYTYTLAGLILPGTKAELSCNEGFQISGLNETRCGINRKWNDHIGSCEHQKNLNEENAGFAYFGKELEN